MRVWLAVIAVVLVAHPASASSSPVTDAASDEWAQFITVSSPTVNPFPACDDPSLDILAMEADAAGGIISVEVEHAAAVLSPQLTCAGQLVQVWSQRYLVAVGGYGDEAHLILMVKTGESPCLYVFFASPVETSQCIGDVEVDGTFIRLEASASGDAPMPGGGTRAYDLEGTYNVHASNFEYAGEVPNPWPVGLLVPGWLMLVGDYSDVDGSIIVDP